ncbi:MAG: hypothetical protein ACETV0_03470 [Nitrososphaeria archaeon]
MRFIKVSGVRKAVAGYRAGEEFFKALDRQVGVQIKTATMRAKANKRKTLRGCDL